MSFTLHLHTVCIIQYFQIPAMSKFKYKEGIRIEDCPPGNAPLYAGKKNRNNTGGSDLSKNDFIDKVIEDWILHFDNMLDKTLRT